MKCEDIACDGQKATHLVLDCAEGSPVCAEHAKRKHVLGSDGKPFRVIPIFKGWRSNGGWVEDQLKKRRKARRIR